MSIPSDLAKVIPKDARLGFRNHSLEGVSCAQLSAGYLQANIACVPSNMADDFEEFCRLNSSPCPLLYRSKPGEVSAAPLAENSDIRYEVKGAPSDKCSPSLRYHPSPCKCHWIWEFVSYWYGSKAWVDWLPYICLLFSGFSFFLSFFNSEAWMKC